jgi:hypothetical protein
MRPPLPASRLGAALVVAVVSIVAACEPSSTTPPTSDAGASPNASILPAPLATEAPELLDAGGPMMTRIDAGPQGIPADSAGRLVLADAGAPVPEALRADPIAPESPTSREVAGLSLDAVFRWKDVPSPPKAPEVSADGIREAQKLTALTWKIDLADAGRMRIDFTSRALPLPAHAEIRARSDRYGNLVLWPMASEYRVIQPGALRTVVGERRVDVTPLVVGTVKSQGEGRRLGLVTRKVELGSSLGTLKLELGKSPEVGDGGQLLCRVLVEMNGIDPKSAVCQPGEVPLSAIYAWSSGDPARAGGGVTFEVTTLTKRTDVALNGMLTPPPGASFAPTGLPAVPHGIFLSREELAAFRTGALTLPPSTDASAPGEGFVAVNHSDALLYLLLDGVPVVAVPPGADRYVIGPLRGHYVAQWRTFLGEKVYPAQTVDMPARLTHGGTGGAVDAGAPDGG